MSRINLLPKIEDQQTEFILYRSRKFTTFLIWAAVTITSYVLLFFFNSYHKSRVQILEAQKKQLILDIENLGEQKDKFYDLTYRKSVLSKIKSTQYKPSVLRDYIDEKVKNMGKINKYEVNSYGSIEVYINSANYTDAVYIWHRLLEDKNIMKNLNLHSFSKGKNPDGTETVTFSLKGNLNVKELTRNHEQSGTKEKTE